MAELIFLENLFSTESFTIYSIDDVDYINESKFALSYKYRCEAINTPEFRNDWPFFIRKRDRKILGFNAYSPVNFTYEEKTLGKDIIEIVSFSVAQKENFDFIKNHVQIPVKVLCGYDTELIDKIINQNSVYRQT
ncbi:MAG: hypothetical protein K1X55_03820 [Chitinophagales bacterium]|nr:hypothetical protein [Chitinophagales bacterium]